MGPSAGFRIIEFAGIGPGPMCAMLLADMGATVLRLDRPTKSNLGIERPERFKPHTRIFYCGFLRGLAEFSTKFAVAQKCIHARHEGAPIMGIGGLVISMFLSLAVALCVNYFLPFARTQSLRKHPERSA